MAKSNKALDVVDIDQFKAAYYPAADPHVIRRTVTTLLLSYNIAINPHKVTPTDLDGASSAEQLASVEGTTWVLARGNTSEYTYPITAGKPVCFCVLDAASVTGVNPLWTDDEFSVVGTALEDFVSSGPAVIMVKLTGKSLERKLPVKGMTGFVTSATGLDFVVELTGGNNTMSGCGDTFPLEFHVEQSTDPFFNGAGTPAAVKLRWKTGLIKVPILTNAWLTDSGQTLNLRKQHIALPASLFCSDPEDFEMSICTFLTGCFCEDDGPAGTRLFGMIDGVPQCFEVGTGIIS